MIGRLAVIAMACSGALFPAALASASEAARHSVVAHYYEVARQATASGGEPSAQRGATFFASEHKRADGASMSCTTCHTSDPRQTGKTRAHKPILPLAPAVNEKRLSDRAYVEKWFERNCRDVLSRACTPMEKADFIAYLISVKP